MGQNARRVQTRSAPQQPRLAGTDERKDHQCEHEYRVGQCPSTDDIVHDTDD